MSQRYIRPKAHETDTRARGQVARAIPASWEYREPNGRDYGIDMIIELFESGKATGSYLLFQIKGTQAEVKTEESELTFDLPIQTLKYSEMFVTPVLLVICPVNADPPFFYYLWLQEYIRVILDHDKPKCRSHQKS